VFFQDKFLGMPGRKGKVIFSPFLTFLVAPAGLPNPAGYGLDLATPVKSGGNPSRAIGGSYLILISSYALLQNKFSQPGDTCPVVARLVFA
jgi:hypothetical protein